MSLSWSVPGTVRVHCQGAPEFRFLVYENSCSEDYI